MSMLRDLLDVMEEMINEGGLQVVTLLSELEGAKPVSSPSPVCQRKVYGHVGIRTIIQLDSDCVTTISSDVLAMPELWQRHTTILQAKLSILRRILLGVEKSTRIIILIISIIILILNMTAGASSEQWVCSIMGVAVIAMVRKWAVRVLLLPLILWTARRYIQWRL